MQAQVMIDGEMTDVFHVAHGVKQGCVLAPTLFTLFLAAGLPPLLHILDSLSIFEKLRSCINPLPGHRTPHRTARFCSMVSHLTSLPPLNTLANDFSLDKELSARIQSASAAFGRLRERLRNKHNTKLVTKCKVYHAIILSRLLYRS